MYESELAHHLEEQGRVDETQPCAICGEPVLVHDRETWDSWGLGIAHGDCAAANGDEPPKDNGWIVVGSHPHGISQEGWEYADWWWDARVDRM